MDLRCENGILFARIVEVEGLQLIEVKCRSSRCRTEPGVMVFHRFRFTGTLDHSVYFRDPGYRKEESNDHHSRSAAVRSA